MTPTLDRSGSESQDLAASERLKGWHSHALGLADEQTVQFNIDTWRRWLGSTADPTRTGCRLAERPAARAMLERLSNGSISRPELRDVARSSRTDDDYYGLFLATMVWGRGNRNGRMRDALLKALASEELPAALTDTARSIPADERYRAWRKHNVPGLGEAFFTKWLWAASLIEGSPATALVLDQRVWATLTAPISTSGGGLGWSSIIAAGSRDRSLRYRAYVESCARWAADIGCGIEDIEFLLFDGAGCLPDPPTDGRVSPT